MMAGVYQISRQIKAHDGSVFTLCQMRNGLLLTGGGKDRKIILWDHDLNPEREIEVRPVTEAMQDDNTGAVLGGQFSEYRHTKALC